MSDQAYASMFPVIVYCLSVHAHVFPSVLMPADDEARHACVANDQYDHAESASFRREPWDTLLAVQHAGGEDGKEGT